jgi:hypothetical protein
MNIIHRSKLRHVDFILAAGDIFDASVDAIVNSEQTDFVLSRNPDSVSGQIWNRYGVYSANWTRRRKVRIWAWERS